MREIVWAMLLGALLYREGGGKLKETIRQLAFRPATPQSSQLSEEPRYCCRRLQADATVQERIKHYLRAHPAPANQKELTALIARMEIPEDNIVDFIGPPILDRNGRFLIRAMLVGPGIVEFSIRLTAHYVVILAKPYVPHAQRVAGRFKDILVILSNKLEEEQNNLLARNRELAAKEHTMAQKEQRFIYKRYCEGRLWWIILFLR